MTSITEPQVVEALENVFDPEIPVDIWNFGLIYGIQIENGNAVKITMTLTSESCPSAKQIPDDVKKRILRIPGAASCDVEVVWDPKWSAQKISPKGREILGLDEEES